MCAQQAQVLTQGEEQRLALGTCDIPGTAIDIERHHFSHWGLLQKRGSLSHLKLCVGMACRRLTMLSFSDILAHRNARRQMRRGAKIGTG